MAKEIRPWYRWHWNSYETSKHVLDFCLSTDPMACHGCYRVLIDEMWKRGCRLPTDRRVLWKLAGANSLEDYERVADLVEKCFDKTEDGQFFTSELLLEEWNSATSLLEKKRKAGQAGGQASAQARAQADVEQPFSQQTKQTSTVAQASSSSSTVSKENNADDDIPASAAATAFMTECRVSGKDVHYSATDAISLRKKIANVKNTKACEQLIAEYDQYRIDNPDPGKRKGVKSWLASCNEDYSPPKKITFTNKPDPDYDQMSRETLERLAKKQAKQ